MISVSSSRISSRINEYLVSSLIRFALRNTGLYASHWKTGNWAIVLLQETDPQAGFASVNLDTHPNISNRYDNRETYAIVLCANYGPIFRSFTNGVEIK